VFNSAAQGISVDDTKGDVVVQFKADRDEVSTKKLRRKMQKEMRNRLYSHFVKAATLHGGSLVEELNTEDQVEEVKDLSHSLSDDDLVRACGGRTAHKGARHGQTMSAKLARVAEAERVYLEQLQARLKAKETAKQDKIKGANPPVDVDQALGKVDEPSANGSSTSAEISKKKKKKHKNKEVIKEDEASALESSPSEISTEPDLINEKRKKKKKDKDRDFDPSAEDESRKNKQGKSKKKSRDHSLEESTVKEEVLKSTPFPGGSAETNSQEQEEDPVHSSEAKKKKKKRKREHVADAAAPDPLESVPAVVGEPKKKKKRKDKEIKK